MMRNGTKLLNYNWFQGYERISTVVPIPIYVSSRLKRKIGSLLTPD